MQLFSLLCLLIKEIYKRFLLLILRSYLQSTIYKIITNSGKQMRIFLLKIRFCALGLNLQKELTLREVFLGVSCECLRYCQADLK